MSNFFLYNTETRRKEEVFFSKERAVSIYTCGPTVYNFAHIGNFRTYLFEDLLRRSLQYFGYRVEQVMNITDVDDKTIAGAIREGVSLDAFTKPFTESFFADLETLSIEKAEHYPKATDFIDKMIEMIQVLIDKKMAYVGSDRSVYFSISSFPPYGRLSHLKPSGLKAAARVEHDEYDKEVLADFVLWKAYDPKRDGSIYWQSPFGPGRPGWHIECSAMSTALLKTPIDIHVGGVDNMFPHHENEIAQSEGCCGHQFVRLWLHAEHLLVDHKKMSKSLKNFYTLRDLLAIGFTGRQVRLMLLSGHYRTQLNFTLDGLKAACVSLERLSSFIYRVKESESLSEDTEKLELFISKADRAFSEALLDDLNISVAIATLFDFVRDVNGCIDAGLIGKEGAARIFQRLRQWNRVLAFIPLEAMEEEDFPEEVIEALHRREVARKAKKWKEADAEREYLHSFGYVVEDTAKGPRLVPIPPKQ